MTDIATVSQGILSNLSVSVTEISKLALPPQVSAQLAKSGGVDQIAEHILSRTWAMSFRAMAAVLIVTAGWLISTWVASRIQHLLVRMRVEETLAAFLGSMLRFVVFFTTFVLGMITIGVNTTSLAAILGATGLAVGLALKGTLGHVASGVMLMVHRPFKVGDWVETTGNIQGTVKRTGLFSTEINSIDNKRLFIPNTILWENIIFNHTYMRMRMQEFTLLLSYLEPTDDVLAVIRKTVGEFPYVLKIPEPQVGITGLRPLGAECTIRVWHKKEDYAAVQFGLMGRVKTAMDIAGFNIPTQPQVWKTEVERQWAEAAAEKAAKAVGTGTEAAVAPKAKAQKATPKPSAKKGKARA